MRSLYFTLFLMLVVTSAFAQPVAQYQRIEASTIMSNSEYGRGVCINGDYAIVSALLDNHEGTLTEGGAAFVYHYEDGVWNFQFKLISQDPDAKDHFGRSVFINDTHAIVGCTYSDDPDSYNGSAYIFVNNGDGTWSQQAKLLASDRRRMDRYGVTVGIDGNYAIVGCYGADYDVDGVEVLNAGAAYIYEFDGTSWGNEVILHPDEPLTEEKFGWCVSILGNTALIGAYEDRNNNADGYQGAAYIFQQDGGTWSQTQKLTPSDIVDGDNFGYSVDLSEGYAIVGAMNDDDDNGSAYIYRSEAGAYVREQKITASNGQSGDNFGFSVGIDGGQAIVGAWHSDKGYGDTGSAYIFTRDAATGTWSQFSELIAEDASYNDQNGWFVSISGDFALTGAPRWDADKTDLSVDLETNEGSAYIFASADAGSPVPSIDETSPAHSATSVVINPIIDIVFDTDIAFTDAGAQIVVASKIDDSVVSSFDITGLTTTSDLSIISDTLRISNLSLDYGTTYYVQFVNEPIADLDGVAFDGLTGTTEFEFTTVYTSPVWNDGYPSLANQTISDIELNLSPEFTGDSIRGLYYAVLTTDASLTAAQVMNGSDESAIWSVSSTIEEGVITVQNINVSALDSETEYFVSAVVENYGGLTTDVITLSFTTFDTEAPSYMVSYPSISDILGREAQLNVGLNEGGSVYYVLLTDTITATPSLTNVVEGVSAYGASPISSDTIEVNANVAAGIVLEGLEYETNYDVYVVAADSSGNFIETVSPTVISFTTPTLSESVPVASFTPEDGSVDVSTSQSLSIAFNKAIYLIDNPTEEVSDLTVESLLSFKAINSGVSSPYDAPKPPVEELAFSATYDAVNYVITVTPSVALSDKQVYELSIASVLDEEGSASYSDTTTFVTADESAPITQFINPQNGDTDFSISAALTIVFDETIWTSGRKVYSSDLASLISFTNSDSSEAVDFEAAIDSSYRVVTVRPLGRLTPSANYSLVFSEVADSIGQIQSAAAELSFQAGPVNVWTGLGDLSTFSDDANWVAAFEEGLGAIIPEGTEVATIDSDVELDFIIIEAEAGLTINTGVTVTLVNDLLIESSENGNGSLINNGILSVNSENVRIQQLVPSSNQWYYLASPVKETGEYAIEGSIDEFVSVQKANGSYYDVNFGDSLYPFEGLILQGNGTITFTGEPNNGEESVAIENNLENLGWNLLGNSYTAAIDWDLIPDVNKEDIENNFWVWLSTDQYGTYNGSLGMGVNLSGDASLIPSMQSIWVKAIAEGDITLDNSCLAHNDKSYFNSVATEPQSILSQSSNLKSATATSAFPYVKLSGVNGTNVDETVIAFVQGATSGIDSYDSEKRFGSNVDAIELFSVVNNNNLTISSFPEFTEEVNVSLGYKVQAQGNYRIRLDESVFDENVEVTLIDNSATTSMPMTIGSYYEFYSAAVESSERFEINIKPIATNPTKLNELEEGVSIKAYNNQVEIVVNDVEGGLYKIYDLAGRVIKTGELTDVKTIVPMGQNGVYIVEVFSSSITVKEKCYVE